MARAKPGERVAAILRATEDEVWYLGAGVFVGYEVPDESAAGMAALAREAECENPKILLDSGEVVWGGECWWGPEQAVLTRVAKFKTRHDISITVARADAQGS